ncbi:MAG: enterocin [Acidobacteriales bacterium]|nr:enterocin [Terriglobales bacterium]
MFRRIIKITLVGVATLMTVSAHGQQSRWATKDDATANYMISMERQWAESACKDNGVAEKILADDFQGTSTKGERYTKKEEMQPPSSSNRPHDCKLDDAKVRFFGNEMAIAYGAERRIVPAKGTEETQCQIWTDVWLKRKGKWQIVAAQDSKVECK